MAGERQKKQNQNPTQERTTQSKSGFKDGRRPGRLVGKSETAKEDLGSLCEIKRPHTTLLPAKNTKTKKTQRPSTCYQIDPQDSLHLRHLASTEQSELNRTGFAERQIKSTHKTVSAMPPQYTLYTPEASFRAFATLIAAEYNGVDLAVSTDAKAASKSPVGKLPVLECSDTKAVIFSSHAIARFVGNLRGDSGLMGSTPTDASAIDAWMDWCATDLELPATVWFYPVAGYMPFHKARCVWRVADFSGVCFFCVVEIIFRCSVERDETRSKSAQLIFR